MQDLPADPEEEDYPGPLLGHCDCGYAPEHAEHFSVQPPHPWSPLS